MYTHHMHECTHSHSHWTHASFSQYFSLFLSLKVTFAKNNPISFFHAIKIFRWIETFQKLEEQKLKTSSRADAFDSLRLIQTFLWSIFTLYSESTLTEPSDSLMLMVARTRTGDRLCSTTATVAKLNEPHKPARLDLSLLGWFWGRASMGFVIVMEGAWWLACIHRNQEVAGSIPAVITSVVEPHVPNNELLTVSTALRSLEA